MSNAHVTDVPLHSLNFYLASSRQIQNIRFGVFDSSGNIVASRPTGFRTSGRSLLYDYKGPNPILFFRESNDLSQGDQPQRKIVGRVDFDPSENIYLFFFMPNPNYPDSGLEYQIIPVSIDPDKIPAGHLLIYNTMPLTFRGISGGRGRRNSITNIEVSPGLNTPMNIYPSAQLILALESEEDEVFRVYENTISSNDNQRVVLFLLPPRFPGSLNISGGLITLPIIQQDEQESEEK